MISTLLTIDTAHERGQLVIRQKVLSGTGFDSLELMGGWHADKHAFSFIAKRDNKKMADAKIFILDDGARLGSEMNFSVKLNSDEVPDKVPQK